MTCIEIMGAAWFGWPSEHEKADSKLAEVYQWGIQLSSAALGKLPLAFRGTGAELVGWTTYGALPGSAEDGQTTFASSASELCVSFLSALVASNYGDQPYFRAALKFQLSWLLKEILNGKNDPGNYFLHEY